MNVGDLRKIIADLPDETRIVYKDMNFGTAKEYGPVEYEFEIEKGKLLVPSDLWEPVD